MADDFNTVTAQGSASLGKAGSALVYEFIASGSTLHIVLDGTTVAPAADLSQNPLLNGVTLEEIPTAASAPLIAPGGAAFESSVAVSIANSAAAGGATIRYTTDGSTPSATHGAIYTSPFSLSNSATVRAMATGGGWLDSSVSTASYTVLTPLKTDVPPTASPPTARKISRIPRAMASPVCSSSPSTWLRRPGTSPCPTSASCRKMAPQARPSSIATRKAGSSSNSSAAKPPPIRRDESLHRWRGRSRRDHLRRHQRSHASL